MTAPKRPKPGSKPAAKPAAKSAAGKRPAAPPPRAAARPAARPAAPRPEPAPKQPPRGPLMAKLHKALRAAYKPVAPKTDRPLLEQALFACCLEDAPADVAERAFARLMERSFDLNEVRVTTVAELAESLHDLPDPPRAALALRRVLQGVFESTYSFSLEHARKHSLAHGIKTLEHLHGISPFVVHYVASTALGGHLIPLDRGALGGLFLCGIVSQQEYDAGKVAGLERFVPKKAGVEFASLLHQFGVECLTNLHGATVKKVVTAVNGAAKDRFPKRGDALPAPVPPPPPPGKEGQRAAEAARLAAEELRPAGPQAAARPAGKTPLPPPGSGPKRTDGKTASGKPGPKPFVVKPNIGKPITIKPQTAAPPPPQKPPAKPPAKPKPAAARPAKIQPRGAAAASKTAARGGSRELAKRKPR
jgi:hypothetical protein